MRKVILSFILVLLSVPAYAMREPTARTGEFYDVLKTSLSARSEVKAKFISVLTVNYTELFANARIIQYLESLGYKIQKFDLQSKPERVYDNFDFIFFETHGEKSLKTTIANLMLGLRQDGVLFIKTKDRFEGMEIILTAQQFDYDVMKEQDLIVIKRKFEDKDLFSVFVMEINEILTLGMSA